MKSYPIVGYAFVLLIPLLFSSYVNCQVLEPFDELDLSEITSDFFWPQTFQDMRVPDPS